MKHQSYHSVCSYTTARNEKLLAYNNFLLIQVPTACMIILYRPYIK